MQGAEERRLRRMSNTPQGGAIEGNAADDALMVDQGDLWSLSWLLIHGKQVCQVVLFSDQCSVIQAAGSH